MTTNRELVATLRAAGYTGPTSYGKSKLLALIGAHCSTDAVVAIADAHIATTAEPTDTAKFDLPEKSADFFRALCQDAGNWSGSPLVGGNVDRGRANGGLVAKLNAAGLTTSYPDEEQKGCYWVVFTELGRSECQRVLGFDPDPQN